MRERQVLRSFNPVYFIASYDHVPPRKTPYGKVGRRHANKLAVFAMTCVVAAADLRC